MGRHQGPSEAEGESSQRGQKSLLWFRWGGKGKAGLACLGVVSLNNLSRLWGIGTLWSWLVCDSGVMGAEEQGPECERSREELEVGWGLRFAYERHAL